MSNSWDEYIAHYNSFGELSENKKFDSPIWHIHAGSTKEFKTKVNFNSLINLVSICNTNDKSVIWGFVNKYDSNITAKNNPEFDKLIEYALNYYHDFVLPNKKYLKINSTNRKIFQDIIDLLKNDISNSNTAEDIQTLLYELGKQHKFDNLMEFFKLVYKVLLGQEKGPRLGSFIKLYGVKETIDLIQKILEK